MAKQEKVLLDICEFIVDCEHKTASIQSTGYPSIRTPNIGKGRLILDNVNRVSEETYKIWTQRAEPQQGDLILAREAPVGNVAIIPKNLKVCLGQRTVLIRPNRNVIDPNYLVYLLLGPDMQSRIHSLSNGATVHHLNMMEIRKLNLPDLPPLPIQRKIADILSAYDDLIENNTRRITIVEEMARTLYQEWFVKFRFPGHEHAKMVDSEMGMIPEGWKVVNLEDVAGINLFSLPNNSEIEEIRYVDITSVSTGQINKTELIPFHLAPGRARRIVKHGDIIWSTVRPNRKSYSMILNPPENLIVSSGFAVIAAQNIPYTYIYSSITTNIFTDYLTSRATGSAYPAVNKRDFQEAPLLLPSQSLLNRFHVHIESSFIQRQILHKENDNLRRTRDLLLPKLISGEIDVSSWVDTEEQESEEIVDQTMGKVPEAEPAPPIDVAAMQQQMLWD